MVTYLATMTVLRMMVAMERVPEGSLDKGGKKSAKKSAKDKKKRKDENRIRNSRRKG